MHTQLFDIDAEWRAWFGEKDGRMKRPMAFAKRPRGPVIQYSKEGVELGEWESVKKASEGTGVRLCNISSCITGRLKTAGGFTWKRKYKDPDS